MTGSTRFRITGGAPFVGSPAKLLSAPHFAADGHRMSHVELVASLPAHVQFTLGIDTEHTTSQGPRANTEKRPVPAPKPGPRKHTLDQFERDLKTGNEVALAICQDAETAAIYASKLWGDDPAVVGEFGNVAVLTAYLHSLG